VSVTLLFGFRAIDLGSINEAAAKLKGLIVPEYAKDSDAAAGPGRPSFVSQPSKSRFCWTPADEAHHRIEAA
jgi:hypothetical protein